MGSGGRGRKGGGGERGEGSRERKRKGERRREVNNIFVLTIYHPFTSPYKET